MYILLRIKRMQLRNHADTQPVKPSQRYMGYTIYTYRIKFRNLDVRENETALRKLSGGTAQLCTLEGSLHVSHIASFDISKVCRNNPGKTSQ